MKTLLTIRDMSIGYQDKTLYSGISLDIHEGDCIMLCGANGSGKTTLMKSIARSAGDGLAAMIPSRIPKVKGFTSREFIRICCYSRSDMGGRLTKEQEAAVNAAMDRMELGHLSDRDISTLSDGEFQKATIAAALAREASIILLDEPTAFLDAENRINVLKALRDICDSDRHPAVIFSTHDLHDGLSCASKVIALGADGRCRCSSEDLEKTVSTIFHKA